MCSAAERVDHLLSVCLSAGCCLHWLLQLLFWEPGCEIEPQQMKLKRARNIWSQMMWVDVCSCFKSKASQASLSADITYLRRPVSRARYLWSLGWAGLSWRCTSERWWRRGRVHTAADDTSSPGRRWSSGSSLNKRERACHTTGGADLSSGPAATEDCDRSFTAESVSTTQPDSSVMKTWDGFRQRPNTLLQSVSHWRSCSEGLSRIIEDFKHLEQSHDQYQLIYPDFNLINRWPDGNNSC